MPQVGGGDLPTASGEPKKGPQANGLTKTKKYMVPFDYVLWLNKKIFTNKFLGVM